MWKILGKCHVSYLVVGWSVAVIAAMAWCCVFGLMGDEVLRRMAGAEVVVSGAVMEDAEGGGSGVALRLGDLEIDGERVEGMLYVEVATEEKIERSDRVTLSGRLSEGFGVFGATMWRPFLREVAKPNPPDVALGLRNWFAGLVRQFIPAPQADLAMGYLLGQKKALPEEFAELLTEVGLTHIVVASGYNLSILVGGMRRIFGKVSRFAAVFFAALLVMGFAAVVGLSASMVRASIVALLGLFAWYAGRKFHPVKLLLLVAAITLLINPVYIMDLGWYLSFASFAGVMIVGPILLKYFYGDREPNFVQAVLVETMAAQVCCLPVILYFSGSFSLVGVVANVLILPSIPVTMALTFATGMLAFLPLAAGVLGWVANVILSYHVAVVEFFGEMKWAIFEIEEGNAWVLAGYAVIFLTVYYMKKKAKFRLIESNVLEL